MQTNEEISKEVLNTLNNAVAILYDLDAGFETDRPIIRILVDVFDEDAPIEDPVTLGEWWVHND